ncbi:TPA: PHP domain-containing protein [bacterium]|nr:PHP domain-containing protein [bacterium]
MIDLHTHTFLSDGELIPSEHVHRAYIKGIEVIGLTDHVDPSNIDFIVTRLVKVSEELNKYFNIKVVPGCELTHVPPSMIKDLAKEARRLGAKIVVVHGETIAETVPQGTNRAAVEADIDILAHPGLIAEEEVKLAKKNGIFLEITARAVHAFTNGRTANLAEEIGASLILNTDAHSSKNFIDREFGAKIALGCGLSLDLLLSNSRKLLKK